MQAAERIPVNGHQWTLSSSGSSPYVSHRLRAFVHLGSHVVLFALCPICLSLLLFCFCFSFYSHTVYCSLTTLCGCVSWSICECVLHESELWQATLSSLQKVTRRVWWTAWWRPCSLEQPSVTGGNEPHAMVRLLYTCTSSCLKFADAFKWIVHPQMEIL